MNNLSGRQFGNYRLLRLLGQGGFADTYLGEQIYVHTQAAVKIVQTQFGQGDQESFFNEARMIAHLNHPNIVRLIDFGVSDSRNTPYLIMEYASNGTLRQRHPRGEIVPIERIVQYVRNIAAALQYAHGQKVIHRDVKPENMLISTNQEILLGDFGIAVVQSSRIQSMTNVAGTVSYMAPEQIQGHAVPASDQYGLAVVIYEWLCGAPLFTGSYAEIAAQHAYATPPPLRQRVATIPAEVEQVVLTALSKDPQRRFRSVEAFANAFAQASKADSGRRQMLVTDSQANIPTVGVPYSGPYAGPQPAVPYPPTQTAYGFPQDRQDVDLQSPLPPPPPGYGSLSGAYNPQTPSPVVPEAFTPRFTPQMTPNAPQYTPHARVEGVSAGSGSGVTPTPPVVSKSRRPSTLLLLVLVAAIVLIIGSVAIVYAAVYRPFIHNVQATATVSAQTTGTVLAQANATGTVVSQTTATQTALQNLYAQATNGTPNLNDPLKSPDNYGWSHFTGSTGMCNYIDGTYHSRAPVGYFEPCYASATNFTDFAFQVQVKIVSGVLAGIMYRAPNINNDFSGYYFKIGTDGSYQAYKVTVDKQGNNFPTLVSGSSAAIHSGLNQTNLLAVVARGNALYFYVNKQYVNKATDSDYKGGVIGVFTDSSDTSGTEAVFSNAQVWQLS